MSKHTDLVHLGRDPRSQQGVVNLPVYHASTILYPNIAAFKNRAAGDRKYRGVRYGAYGTPTTFPWPIPWRNWRVAQAGWLPHPVWRR